MKRFLMIALLIGAIPAVAVGQMVTCDVCSHDVSVYMGSGGFIAEAAGDEVVWVAHCGGVTVSGELEPGADGIVSMLFNEANGLACDDEESRLQLGPVMDGGWYWITDDMNSAVGSLVDSDVYDNLMDEQAMPTDAGDGVEKVMGRGAVYLKETATGRVGILPTLQPSIPMPPPRLCGHSGGDIVNTKCTLGDGGVKINVKVNTTSGTRMLASGETIYRPVNGSLTITADVWANGTGHYSTDANNVTLGDGMAEGASPIPLTAFDTTLAQPGTSQSTTLADAGVVASLDGTTHVLTLTINQSATFCGTAAAPLDHMASLTLTPTVDASAATIVPTVNVGATKASINVACRMASANQGVELVPENPFPTDE